VSRMDTWPHSVRSLSAARSFCSTEKLLHLKDILQQRYRCSQRLAALIWIVLTREVLEHNKQKKVYSALTFVDTIESVSTLEAQPDETVT
jgi:hypothetical protein